MADKTFGKTSGAYLFAKICSILVKRVAMTVLVIDTDEELVGDDRGDEKLIGGDGGGELPELEKNGLSYCTLSRSFRSRWKLRGFIKLTKQ
jgi:hypothetical protein